MAKTKAKKLREKMVREGKRDPIANRSAFSNVDMYKMTSTKKTKTKKDRLTQIKHKERLTGAGYSDGYDRSFLVA